jgi:hypothetical protein
MEIQKITLEIPRCHDIITAETSKLAKMSLKCSQKHKNKKEQE